MSLIDIRCTADPPHTCEVSRPAADWPATPPCPTCGAPTAQIHLPPHTTWSLDPVVVYQAPDGSFRFPGETAASSTAKYDRAGFTRIELRSAADVRRFESQMNQREYARASRRVEHAQRAREAREHQSRAILRDHMQRMTPFGRDVARAAMRQSDDKPRERTREAGFHLEVFSMDRSNREASRDDRGRRRRD